MLLLEVEVKLND